MIYSYENMFLEYIHDISKRYFQERKMGFEGCSPLSKKDIMDRCKKGDLGVLNKIFRCK